MSNNSYTFKKFIKDWMLVISMTFGVLVYLLYHGTPGLHAAGPVLLAICKRIQPLMLFAMLFLSFCKIEPHQMRPHRWMQWLMLAQGGIFVALSLLLVWAMHHDNVLATFILDGRFFFESLLLMMICPTATACAVVTSKLGGDMAGVVTYTVLINLLVSILIPTFLPLIYSSSDMSFALAFSKILAKVFPLLIMPCLSAWLLRYLFPHLHERLLSFTDLAFYIWAVSLCLAIVMGTRAIVHNTGGFIILVWIALGSLVACVFQFWFGRKIGEKSGCKVSSGQAMGQKNTVFAMWVGYTFMDPLVSVSGAFYSIWHNAYNSWQLYQRRKSLEIE